MFNVSLDGKGYKNQGNGILQECCSRSRFQISTLIKAGSQLEHDSLGAISVLYAVLECETRAKNGVYLCATHGKACDEIVEIKAMKMLPQRGAWNLQGNDDT